MMTSCFPFLPSIMTIELNFTYMRVFWMGMARDDFAPQLNDIYMLLSFRIYKQQISVFSFRFVSSSVTH